MNDNEALFSQRDPRWARKKIGSSTLTIGGYGCTLTSTCYSLFKLTGKLMTPSEMEDALDFTTQSHPQGAGLILWGSFSKVGLKATRGWGRPKEFKKGMLIELNYWQKYGLMHWVCFESANPDGRTINVFDPWVGEIVEKPIAEISGYTDIISIEEKPEQTKEELEVKESTRWVKEHNVSNGENAKGFLIREHAWVMITRLMPRLKDWFVLRDGDEWKDLLNRVENLENANK